MKVLSLFDGISCGRLALERAGVDVEEYYASEIDEHATKVSQFNWPNIVRLGDVHGIKGSDLPQIDLLMGGSPCQGFSFAGKQLNFQDPRSKLFFEFVRLLGECKPKYYFFENVKMKNQYIEIISSYLKSEPVEVNSSLFSKQSRKRLYWTNIDFDPIAGVPNLDYNQYLYRLGHGYITDEIKFFSKYPTLTAQPPATKYRVVEDLDEARKSLEGDMKRIRRDKTVSRSLTPEECEELQNLPRGYTSAIKKTQRYKSIGNGWTVDVVAHFFKGLK